MFVLDECMHVCPREAQGSVGLKKFHSEIPCRLRATSDLSISNGIITQNLRLYGRDIHACHSSGWRGRKILSCCREQEYTRAIMVQSTCERPQCVAADVHPPRTKLPKNVPPRTDIKYPTFMVMTANILYAVSLLGLHGSRLRRLTASSSPLQG